MALFKNWFTSVRSPNELIATTMTRDSLDQTVSRSRGPETMPVRMDLEERMAFRRELLYETIRASLSLRGIAPHTYRFKAMRTDKRGHCFVIMFDMSPTFMGSPAGQNEQLGTLAALVIANAQTRYGLIVGGVYWRVDETLDASVANWARPSRPALLDAREENAPLSKAQDHQSATPEELADFEAAWNRDRAVQIGERTYSTDLAPLAPEPVQR